ncbi:universal stress protein [Winogradskyella alexanderae]|uniref:Universal stress protein n=1 Tax=Winogradskyella alexanderae TaxID=2877123 RepID=A0ABS7XNP3_9FLAO|nr:universal stress protein [Winogradskyella alexanderae]MCA0131004.1 universal stress protein [Winogradskyella alexanderae]
MKNILIPIDFKGNEHLLLDKALEFASNLKSKVWLLHVAAPDPDYVGFEAGPQSARDHRANKLKEERRQIQGFAKKFEEKGIDAEALLIQGITVETILEKTETLNIDLIIMGYQTYSLFYKIIFGSVSDSLIKKSNIPVLVVPLD